MTDAATVHTEASLRQIFANMEPDRAQTIRECYYEAVQALKSPRARHFRFLSGKSPAA